MSVDHLVTKAKNFNCEDVTYKPSVTNKRGGKSVQVQLKGQQLVLQFPLMLCWGVNERVDEQSGRVSYDLSLDFRNETKSTQMMLERLKEFEAKVKADCVKHSKEWFGKSKMSSEVVDAMFYPLLKYPKMKDDSGEYDYDRAPSLKVKMPCWEGRFNVELFSYDTKAPLYIPPKQNDPLPSTTPVDHIPKASHINGLIQCSGLWFAAGRCGVTWRLLQACVRPPARLVGMGTCHVMDDSDDEEMEQQLASKEKDTTDDINDEEEDMHQPAYEDDEEEEEEPEPEPAPKKKKKVKKVVRKKT